MRLRASRLVAFRIREGHLVAEDPWRRRRFPLGDATWGLLAQFREWRTPGDGELALARELVDAGLLVAEGSEQHFREESLGAWDMRADAHSVTAGGPFPAPVPPRPVALAPPVPIDVGLAEALDAGRAVREFAAGAPVPFAHLGTVLHRTAAADRPNVTVYALVSAVERVAAGAYRYVPGGHGLERVAGPVDAARLCGGLGAAADVGALLLYTYRAAPGRPARGRRAYRSLFLDLGEASRTAHLAACALGLGAFFTAAIRDEAAEAVLGPERAGEIPLGVTGLGVPGPAEARRPRVLTGPPLTPASVTPA
ncbi:hypothetical protein [Actinomadura parmotrematis]|uniref:SagB/ThcOx family dehydrogenase n=1 Tax=Actinomadura parmotrematis TaxID=2864039 RepID=A0ABS7FNA2_9ACTN|nr:hypothetical protein [Actinomadura parmotrematis]MBW8481831.1 hypothetical protein [Actinomadura parmotrematis]